VAAWKNSPDCTQLLIEAGADCHAIDWYGKTPLTLATWMGFHEQPGSLG